MHPCDSKAHGCEQICHKEGEHAFCDCKVRIHQINLSLYSHLLMKYDKTNDLSLNSFQPGFKLGKDQKSCTKSKQERFDNRTLFISDYIATN